MLKNVKAADVHVSSEDIEHVLKTFPILNLVKDKSLVDKAVRLWCRTLVMSGYSKLEDIPNEQLGSYSLSSHCRAVANAAYKMAKVYESVYGAKINYDYVIVGAIVHDIDKPICYSYDEAGKLKLNQFGKVMPHGVYSSYAAYEEGLPSEIAAIPFCHSAHASRVYSGTIEGMLVDTADKSIARTLNMKLTGNMPYKTGQGG